MANLIKDTKVLQTKEYEEWEWGLLFSFLQHPSLKATHINEDALFSRYTKLRSPNLGGRSKILLSRSQILAGKCPVTDCY